ncbi:DUF3472 domain-containing protein [Verrucomicrobiota bacterium sgz303538]
MTRRLILTFASALLASLTAHGELKIPAFTAYSGGDPNALRISATSGITGWKSPAPDILWFGEIKTPGELTASVVLRLPKGEKSKLKLTVGEQSREAVATGGDGDVTLPFGSFTVPRAGYVRFALAAQNPAGQPAGDISTLVLDGPATEGAHFNLEPRRNASSVHLNYTLPKDADIDAFYSEATAVEDPVHTFYMVCGFQRGYFGMQVNSPTERRIIFSVWDSGSGKTAMKRDAVAAEDHTQLLAKGEGVDASAFGGEGTGGHSHLTYPWKTGTKQRFLLTAKAGDNGTAIYTGYWFHPEKNQWMKIASFQAPKASASLGHFHSFSENFVGSNGHLRRKALYGNQWVHTRQGQWVEITEASFSHDPTGKTARLDRCMGVENGSFFLAHGGFVEGFTKFGERFTRPAIGTPPADINLSKLDQAP